MKKNIVNLEIAKALKELGYTPKEVTPYYFKELLVCRGLGYKKL